MPANDSASRTINGRPSPLSAPNVSGSRSSCAAMSSAFNAKSSGISMNSTNRAV
jgi:hypothetical protein